MLHDLKQFNLSEIEEKILKFWKENQVFRKSLLLRQKGNGKSFKFFEGPPTANGMPGMHHVLARAFKDIILRYKTMRGYYVLRKAGWDTHGLPVEIEVEKALGIKNKQEIEKFGIAEFNARAKASVWKYKSEWEKLTERIGFWLDFSDPYVTYNNKYIESVWWIFSQIFKRGLLKKLYKVVPWCPRCQTPLSSHELGQPGAYKKTKDPSVYVKFALRQAQGKRAKTNEFLLVWTTTPWTLPANVAVAVNPQLTYTKYSAKASGGKVEYVWSYNPPPKVEGAEIEVVEKMSGKKLVGLEYEPLYRTKNQELRTKNYKVLAADFVSTEEGTGLVHIAPAFGEDDLKLITNYPCLPAGKQLPITNIPITIDDRGIVNKGLPGAGKFIKEADKDIIADLQKRGLLYNSGVIEHEYPFCWRCSNPLIYFARDSWFIEMSKLRDELMAVNKKINWIPPHIKEGRFGEWLKELKDWSISRERYWGTPLPIWAHTENLEQRTKNKEQMDGGDRADGSSSEALAEKGCDNILVAGSLADLNKHRYSQNKFFITRHTESTHNLDDIIASGAERGKSASRVTKKGIEQAGKMGAALKKRKIDVIYCSPYLRTKQTARIIAKIIGAKIIFDKRIGELNTGIFNGRPVKEYKAYFADSLEKFTKTPPGGENLADVKRRMFAFLRDINQRHNGKNILIVSHGDPLWVLEGAVKGLANEEILKLSYPEIGDFREMSLENWSYNNYGELDLHRPFIDEIILKCQKCGGQMKRVKEVADVWFDSGAMPFAQDHYLFKKQNLFTKILKQDNLAYPADFISEAIDQTRGWFYTLHAIGALMGKGKAFKNVICLGHLLDAEGKKMSKSVGNIVDPWVMLDKYGADTLRLWMYSVNQPGDSKNFDEKTVKDTEGKIITLLYNVLSFYDLYRDKNLETRNYKLEPNNILDQWILVRLDQLVGDITTNLDNYKLLEPVRDMREFINDLSTWYLRRSRDRLKDGDVEAKQTLYYVLKTLAKILAPFAPFTAEDIWQKLKLPDDEISVHLVNWPKVEVLVSSDEVLETMQKVRAICTEGNALRKKLNIAVKQPLASFTVNESISKDYLDIIKDELNVKEIIIGTEFAYDTNITPELKREGDYRELVRALQDLRKEIGLTPSDVINLKISENAKQLLAGFETDLKKTVQISQIVFADGENEITVDEQVYKVSIEK